MNAVVGGAVVLSNFKLFPVLIKSGEPCWLA